MKQLPLLNRGEKITYCTWIAFCARTTWESIPELSRSTDMKSWTDWILHQLISTLWSEFTTLNSFIASACRDSEVNVVRGEGGGSLEFTWGEKITQHHILFWREILYHEWVSPNQRVGISINFHQFLNQLLKLCTSFWVSSFIKY